MKWVWKYIVDDDGNPIEEEVTEEVFNARRKHIQDAIDVLRSLSPSTFPSINSSDFGS